MLYCPVFASGDAIGFTIMLRIHLTIYHAVTSLLNTITIRYAIGSTRQRRRMTRRTKRTVRTIGGRAISRGRGGRFTYLDGGEVGDFGFEAIVAPMSDEFRGGTIIAERFIEMVVVEMRAHQLAHGARDIGEVGDHVALRAMGDEMRRAQLDREQIRVAVHVAALPVVMHELMAGFEREAFAELKHCCAGCGWVAAAHTKRRLSILRFSQISGHVFPRVPSHYTSTFCFLRGEVFPIVFTTPIQFVSNHITKRGIIWEID